MSVSVKEIQHLRGQTGAGMMDCKRALIDAKGSITEAVLLLRKWGLAEIQTRGLKVASEGIVGHYIHAGSKIGVLVEVNCETDFVARGNDFKSFASDIAMHIAAMNPQWISRDDVPVDIVDRETELILSSIPNKPPNIIEEMVKGKMNKFYKQVCLVDQVFVKDPNLTVTDLLGDLASKVGERLVIKRFNRFVIGEE